MLAELVGCVMSEAVKVVVPTVLSVTLKFLDPLLSGALVNGPAFASEQVRLTVSVALETKLQKVSTALTVAVKDVPALWAVGLPLLPVAVSGAVASPGTNSCSFVMGPGLMEMPPAGTDVALAKFELAKSRVILFARL